MSCIPSPDPLEPLRDRLRERTRHHGSQLAAIARATGVGVRALEMFYRNEAGLSDEALKSLRRELG